MGLSPQKAAARVEDLERAANTTFGPGTLSGAWAPVDELIRWKIYLGKEKGFRYDESRDDISEASVLNMVRRHMGGKKQDGGNAGWWSKANKVKDKVQGKPKNDRRSRTKEPEPKVVISDELRERAIQLGMREREITNNGGSRKDHEGNSYWLTLEQLCELDELDRDIDDNDEFNKAFADMRDRLNILPTHKKVTWQSWEGETTHKDYMTGWWKGAGYSSGSGSALGRRLAVGLGVINATVQVINSSMERWRVMLAKEEQPNQPTSYTSFDEKLIVVSPGAMLDTSLKEEEQIHITTGYGLHEASHTEYTTSVMDALMKPTQLEPLAVSSLLLNVLEDVRIEGLTAERFPGFAGYFVTMNAYLWRTSVSKNVLEKWGPELVDKLNAIVQIVKWPTEFKAAVAGKDQDLDDEFTWFRNWIDRYIDGTHDMRTSLEMAIAHLKTDPETAKQMQKQAKEEAAWNAFAKKLEKDFKDMLQDMMKKMQADAGKELQQPCPTPGGHIDGPPKLGPDGKPEVTKPGEDPNKLPFAVGNEVEKLLREQYSKERLQVLPEQFPDQKGHIPSVEVTRPEGLKLGSLKPDALLDRLRHAFRFRKARPMYSNRLMKSGSLDEDEMWRAVMGDNRVFEQRVIEEDPETAVTLLVDHSGSMSGYNIDKAARIARVMLQCLKDMKGVSLRVRAHTDGGGGSVALYRIFEPGDRPERITLLGGDELDMGGNYDAYAIAWCAEELMQNQKPGEDMILFVLSDGRPNGRGLAGMSGMEEVKKIKQIYNKKGVTIIQLAIDRAVGESSQRAMYGNDYIPYIDDASLPRQMTDKMIQLFSSREN